ncbi:lig_chan-Glu_bd domain-containing protein [Caerostris darwini]|uniref:Lig_chan-Glu_bd domain-containing protein n=1 Tax=Caerostris darwini TaxID=1538125 RepID=A0AAV4T2K5_9ARAC|nr:lig_chan-Glu_bd domain-containing protein [Caerostris darwini]
MNCPPVIKVAICLSRELKLFRNDDGSITFSGIQGRFIDLILQALNLKFELVIAEDKESGRMLDDGNWTGTIGKIQRDEAEIALNFISISEPRSRIVDFSTVYMTDDISFAIKKPGTFPTSMAMVYPFKTSIWITTCVVLLLMPFVFRFVLLTKEIYINILLKLLGSVLGQSTFKNQGFLRYKIIICSWIIFGMILSLSYSAVLLSVLTFPSQIPVPRNIEELSKAIVKKNYKCFAPRGSSLLDYLDVNSAILTSRTLLQIVAGREAWKDSLLSEDSLISLMCAFPMKKGFCYKRKLNTLISRLNNAGLYLKIISDGSYKIWLSDPAAQRSSTSAEQPLSCTDLTGAFLILLTGLIFALLILTMETAQARLTKR